MPRSNLLCFVLPLLCLGGAASALAQDTEEADREARDMEEADREARELEEPAPEGVELELTNPSPNAEQPEWTESEAPAEEDEAEAEPIEGQEEAEPEQTEEEEEERETFGDRFKRGDLFGYFDAQGRFFPQTATSPAAGLPVQNDYWFNGSLAWEPGFYMNLTDTMNFELILFGRVDQHDRNRTHGDIREGFFELFLDEWSFGFGVHKVFWGVTESRHLVDIINQVDLVEDFDTDIKLGQAMITTSYTNDKAGTFSLYAMSWARPVVFPGPEGRPTLPFPVDNGIRVYESRLKQGQIDAALRWSHSMAGFDWGLSYFYGTTREPQLFPAANSAGAMVFQPVYDLIHQGGLDVQYTIEGWLLKAEAIVRGGQGPTFGAVTGGFEYTFYQAHGSIVDVGVILEYDYDGRNNNTFIIFKNDFFTAVRLSLSDVGSTEFLAGAYIDSKDGSVFIAAEASRRFGESWKILLEGRGYIPQGANILEFFRNDAQIQLDIEFHY
jgi:hypothetical protein